MFHPISSGTPRLHLEQISAASNPVSPALSRSDTFGDKGFLHLRFDNCGEQEEAKFSCLGKFLWVG